MSSIPDCKFNIGDKIKLVKIDNNYIDDEKHLLNSSGTVIGISVFDSSEGYYSQYYSILVKFDLNTKFDWVVWEYQIKKVNRNNIKKLIKKYKKIY